MNRIALSIAIAALLAPMAQAAAETISGRAHVVDGNTITVEGTPGQIRLFGIDAPTGRQSCRNSYGLRYLCAPRAAEVLSKVIGPNGQVACDPKTKDRQGRIVALCRKDGTDIGSELVRKGWARDYPRYSQGQYAAVEAKAKARKRGAWAGSWQAPSEWREAQASASTR